MSNPGPATTVTNTSQSALSNIQELVVLSVNVGTLAATAANTTAEQSVAVTGLATTDVIVGVSKPTAQAGLGICGYRVASAGNLGITFNNNTAAPITATASELYSVTVARLTPAAKATAVTSMPLL